jgi:death-on-curing protein
LPTARRRYYRLTIADALEAHERALKVGGLAGVLDQGRLEAAIARPYCGYYRSIAKKAAAITEAVACRHAFVDGNKRTAFLLAGLLVERSGYELRDPDLEAEEMLVAVVEHQISFDDLVQWFQQRIFPT